MIQGAMSPDGSTMTLKLKRSSEDGRPLNCSFIIRVRDGMILQEVTEAAMPLDIEAEMIKVLTPTSPCFFPGCQEVRALYLAEKAKLPSDCTPCQEGNLQRRFMKDILPKLEYFARKLAQHSGAGGAGKKA